MAPAKKKTCKRKKRRERLFTKYKGKCFYCGARTIYNECELNSSNQHLLATIDHIVPVDKGGKSGLYNCVLSCIRCNMAKTNLDLEDFLLYQAINPNFHKMDWIIEELLETEEEVEQFFLMSEEERQFIQLRMRLVIEDGELGSFCKTLKGLTEHVVLGGINVKELRRARQAGQSRRSQASQAVQAQA
jgi:CRISPR/Cas system Type II protein with McrA/HNH and RuvC-like nuclease domain